MSLARVLELFITFFLANVLSRIVSNKLDLRQKNHKEKGAYDKQLATRILNNLSHENLARFLRDTGNGRFRLSDYSAMCEVISMLETTRFYGIRLQKAFEGYVRALTGLATLCDKSFTRSGEDSGQWSRIHKYEMLQDGEKRARSEREAVVAALRATQEAFEDFESQVRKRYPGVFLVNSSSAAPKDLIRT